MNALFDRKAKYKLRLLWRICGLGEIGLAQAAKSGGQEASELGAALLGRHSVGWEGVDLQHW